MAQKTQFYMTKDGASMNVQPTDLATYIAAGWSIAGIRYSEGGEGVDANSQILMRKGDVSIYVRAAAVADYLDAGYTAEKVLYGSGQTEVLGTLEFLDTPTFSSAEVGTVAATKVAVTFSTEIVADDYAAGVTIEVDDAAAEISAAERQSDHTVVHYTIAAVAFGEVVTWSYDDASGGIKSEVDGSIMDDVSDGEVTNNVAEEE